MSDNFYRFVPVDPHHVPSDAAAPVSAARACFPEADEVQLLVEPGVVFWDAGGNFESVRCPSCAADLMEAWGGLMNADFDGEGFRLATHALPCCGKPATVAELVYVWPQAFGRSALEVRNGGGPVREEDVAAIAAAMGCAVRVVYQHI